MRNKYAVKLYKKQKEAAKKIHDLFINLTCRKKPY